MLVMSLRRFSLAIKPAGSSLPLLIRKPVLSRVSASFNAALDRPNVFWATKELTFVLIRVIAKPPYGKKRLPPESGCLYLVGPDRYRCVFHVEGTSLSILSCAPVDLGITRPIRVMLEMALSKRRSRYSSGRPAGKFFYPRRVIATGSYSKYRPRQLGDSASNCDSADSPAPASGTIASIVITNLFSLSRRLGEAQTAIPAGKI